MQGTAIWECLNTTALLEPYFRFTHLIASDDWNRFQPVGHLLFGTLLYGLVQCTHRKHFAGMPLNAARWLASFVTRKIGLSGIRSPTDTVDVRNGMKLGAP
jgi:hypothetical protein